MTEVGWVSLSTIDKTSVDYAFGELDGESDRAAALVAASIVDAHLGAAIKWHMRHDEKLFGEMFNGSGPLGTFSSKINLAYLLTIISKESMSELHCIRKIRNAFAHDFSALAFEKKGQVRDLTLNLKYPLRMSIKMTPVDYPSAAIDFISDADKDELRSNVRKRYVLTCKLFSTAFAFLCSGQRLLGSSDSLV